LKSSTQSSQNLDVRSKSILGSGYISMFFIHQGIWILALPFYQMTLGIDPFLLSLAATVPILLATSIGPWVGYLSDHSRSKFGRRKPFMLVSCLVTGVLYGLIWSVPVDWSQEYQFAYLFVLSFIFYLSSTFYVVPMTSLMFESTKDSNERTRVMAFVTVFSKCASVIYQWAFPLSQLAIFGGIYAGVQFVGWFIGIFAIALLGLIPVIWGKEVQQPIKSNTTKTKIKFSKTVSLALANKKLLMLLLLVFVQGGLAVYFVSVDYYLIVYYMCNGDIGEGAFWKGILSSSYAVIGIILVPVITKLAIKHGKTKVLQWVFILTAIGGLVKWFIYVPEVRWLITIDALFGSFIWTSMAIIVPTLIADMCDVEEAQTCDDHKGAFISIYNWVQHFSGSFALIISGITLNVIGFNANLGAEQSDSSMFSMRVILSAGTFFSAVLGWIIMARYSKQQSNR
jgi:Na+/melibiose symporter-like transporter